MKFFFTISLLWLMWTADTRYRDTIEVRNAAGDWSEIPGPYPIEKGDFKVFIPGDKGVEFFRIRRDYGIFNAI